MAQKRPAQMNEGGQRFAEPPSPRINRLATPQSGHAIRYTRPMLLCTVRDCHMALVREKRLLRCARGHSFDVSRSGYINLLGPQERRSRKPGDTAAAAAGRRRLHDHGV